MTALFLNRKTVLMDYQMFFDVAKSLSERAKKAAADGDLGVAEILAASAEDTRHEAEALEIFDNRREAQVEYPPELHAARKAGYLAQVRALTEPQDVGTAQNLAYGCADLGTRFTISGGEVLELGPQEGTDRDIPF